MDGPSFFLVNFILSLLVQLSGSEAMFADLGHFSQLSIQVINSNNFVMQVLKLIIVDCSIKHGTGIY